MTEQIQQFYTSVEQQILAAWAHPADETHLNALSSSLEQLCQQALDIGAKADQVISKRSGAPVEVAMATYVHFDWMTEVKRLLILYRDILFQYQKGLILSLSGDMTPSGLGYLKGRSQETLEAALAHLKVQALPSYNERTAVEYLETTGLRTNPWTVFQEQIQAVQAQSVSLLEQYEQTKGAQHHLVAVEEKIKTSLSDLSKELDRLEGISQSIKQQAQSGESAQKLIKQIETAEMHVQAFNHYNAVNFAIDQLTDQVEKDAQIPHSIEGTQISYKEINFGHDMQAWIESSIFPLIQDSQEVVDTVSNSVKLSLVNIKNRLALHQQEGKEASAPSDLDVSGALKSVDTLIQTKREVLESLSEEIMSRLVADLNINHIYDDNQHFLMAGQQYAITQLAKDQTAWIESIRGWASEQSANSKKLLSRYSNEDALSISERIVRYVKSRQISEDNQQYSGIFSAQGYIGESFWVGRQEELNHMMQLIRDWREGYRGSVVLSGTRYCGKTIFGELISHRYFPFKTIRLQPSSTISINGRSFETGYHIGEAFNFIKKNTQGDEYLIWIDDLELWQDPETPAGTNIRRLLKNIDMLSSQHFIMVSMSNWYLNHYRRMFHIEKVFQAEINLDVMSETDVLQAIIIRHGATHKLLVDQVRKEAVDPNRFASMVSKVCRLSEYNIGDSLNLWSAATKRMDDLRVYHQIDPIYQIPDFINDENSILLRAMMMSKETNDYKLRKMLGKAYKEKYSPIVQRLINVGIVRRHPNGQLEFAESVVNPIGDMLHHSRYINNVR